MIVPAALLLCAVMAGLVYTRPLTLGERYPVLDISQCMEIHGYYDNGNGLEDTEFTIYPDDPDFDEALELFRPAVFRTRPGNILPQRPQRTRTHRYGEGDFGWDVILRFEDVLFPSGDTGSGDMLRIDNFYGDLELHFDGETVKCSVNNQERWLKDVMDIIARYSD